MTNDTYEDMRTYEVRLCLTVHVPGLKRFGADGAGEMALEMLAVDGDLPFAVVESHVVSAVDVGTA